MPRDPQEEAKYRELLDKEWKEIDPDQLMPLPKRLTEKKVEKEEEKHEVTD